MHYLRCLAARWHLQPLDQNLGLLGHPRLLLASIQGARLLAAPLWAQPMQRRSTCAVSALQAGIQNAQLSSAAVGVTNVIGTIIAGSIIEKAGRKQLLTISYSGMAVAMLALAAGSSVPALASSAGEQCLCMTPWA